MAILRQVIDFVRKLKLGIVGNHQKLNTELKVVNSLNTGFVWESVVN